MSSKVSKQADGLQVTAYPGANCVLLAMSITDNATTGLAGFAIWRTPEGGAEQVLLNRISFDTPVTKSTTPQQRTWTPSDVAPFQKFRWVDIPPDGIDTVTTYRVRALYFTGTGHALKPGAEVTLSVDPPTRGFTNFHAAFTRGYISSQAYADRFHNADIRPKGKKTPDFDTKPFQPQYEWLGAGARKALFDFLDDCTKDKTAKVDVFAYDLDEPDIIAAICQFGEEKRLRAVLDNAKLHVGTAVEVQSAAMIKKAAGDDNVVQGHFARFQHNKVFIKRDSAGRAQRVLFGSMNFSVRGLYVQSNNIIVADDPATAGFFAAAFDEAFEDGTSTAKFKQADVAQKYNTISATTTSALPKSAVALSPHANASISLGPATAAVRAANSSVFYAVMQPKGTGTLLGALQTIAAKPTVYSYGTVETAKGLAVQKGEGTMSAVADFAYLKSKVPYPFTAEFDPGTGIHIHDKFIVVDFNDDKPVVFTGSSNLAEGGEQSNGDSLIQIEDAYIASLFAVEALKIFDHYSFRDKMKTATDTKPLLLWAPDNADGKPPWWTAYYDQANIKFRDRCLFAGVPLPAGLASHKDVDWTSIGEGKTPTATKAKTTGKTKTKTPAKKTKKAATKKKTSKKVAKKKSPTKKPRKTAKAAKKRKAAAKRARPAKPAKKKPAKKTTKRKTRTKARRSR